jgi:hypothetical protein
MDLLELPNRPVTRHPWEEVRFEFFSRVLAQHIDLGGLGTVLDVGAGDAWFSGQFAARTAAPRIVCWDIGYTPDFIADHHGRGGTRIELSASRPSTRFDLLLVLDVLEHVEDDAALLDTLVRENLTGRGHVLMSVPAWPWLFSSHDVRLRHYRRYTPAGARKLLAGAGLDIVRSAGLFHSLVLPRAIHVARERLTGRLEAPADLGQWNAPPLMTAAIRGLLTCDGWLSSVQSGLGRSLPGLSWWALCRRAGH